MKKFILLLIIPVLSFGQNLSIAPQISFQSDEIKFNSILYDSYLERPVVLFGVNLHSDLNKNIGINFSTDYGQIEATEDQYFPAYDGIAVPNSAGEIEIIGAHDEYTLTQKTKNVNLIFNLNLQFQITTILNLPDPFSFSVDGGIYGKNNLIEGELEEWGSMSSFDVDAGGNISLVTIEGVMQSRAEIKFWDIGLNLGATFSLNKLNLGAKCLIPVLVQDQQITQLGTGGTEQNYSISTPNIKPSFLFSISYLFNII